LIKTQLQRVSSNEFDHILRGNAIQTLIVCSVTTDVCVHGTVRAATDLGYH
jgi:biuret amidohydrolase